MLAWTLLLPLLKYTLPLPRLVRLMWVPPREIPASEERHRQVSEIARLVYRSRALTRSDNCLERSLLTYRFLAMHSADPKIVVAVGRPGETRGHAWVVVDGVPVNETDATLAPYVPFAVFGVGGKRLTGPVAGGPLATRRSGFAACPAPRAQGGADPPDEPHRTPEVRRYEP